METLGILWREVIKPNRKLFIALAVAIVIFLLVSSQL